MISSELIFKKRLSVLSHFINILNTFFVKHGKKKTNFFILTNFLFKLKHTNQKLRDSAFLKFYNFISRLTPRLNIVSVENKKAGKIFKIPMPPLKNSILQHNFLITYARLTKNRVEYQKFSNQLMQGYLESFIQEKGELFKQKQQSYDILKEHKFRSKKRHDKMIKIKKTPIKDVVKKSKQFYI